MSVAVISSLYGGYDQVNAPVPQSVDCEFIMVTDYDSAPDPWRTVLEPRPSVPPRLASRVAKCNPWLYTDADVAIWVDANIQITSPDFVKWCVDALGDNVLCNWKQPGTDIHEEQRVTGYFRKWDGEPIEQQISAYDREGYPPGEETYWCGIIVRSKDCPKFGDLWMTEMVRWTCQDQIAYAHLMWKMGLDPAPLPMADYTVIYHPDHINFPVAWKYEHYTRTNHSEAQ